MNDEARAFFIVGALIASVSGSGGFVGGRITAPAAPPAEVRYVPIPVPVAPLAEAAPIEPPPPAVVEPAPAPQVEPPVTTPPPIETKPVLPTSRPKVEAAPKPKPAAQPKPRPAPLKNALPSCAVVKREYERMNFSERMAAYHRANAEQIAHGRRCLGF